MNAINRIAHRIIPHHLRYNHPKTTPSSFSSQSNPFLHHSLHNNKTLKQKLKTRSPLTGVLTHTFHNDTDHIETLGLLQYDFLWIDAEHSTSNAHTASKLILASERRNMPTLVRIGYGYHNIIGHMQKFLVAGAGGIILPQCECGDDVRTVVQGVKFPPVGRRGLAGERWNGWCLGDDGTSLSQRVEECNENSIVGVCVESLAAVDRLEDDILKVDGLDFVFVAPTDLSADMGLHGQIRHPDVVEKIEFAGSMIREAGISGGMLVLTKEDYVYWRSRGFNVLCTVAHNLFVDGAKGMIDFIKDYESNEQK